MDQRHPPAPPLPDLQSSNPSFNKELPRPTLTIRRTSLRTNGIALFWNHANNAIISSYQIYVYQETPQEKAEEA